MPVRLRGVHRGTSFDSATYAYVGPHSPYANPFTAGDRGPTLLVLPMDAAQAVDLFAATLQGPVGHCYAARFAKELRGLDLMCTCPPLDMPCHADVLLHLANNPNSAGEPRTAYYLEGPS